MANLYSEWADAERRAKEYPVGRRVKVYYDTGSTTSVLEPGNAQAANTMLSIGLEIALTGMVLLGIAFKVG